MTTDAERFTFIEVNKVTCRVRENGYWEAETGEVWVSRKSLAKCIDVLMSGETYRFMQSADRIRNER